MEKLSYMNGLREIWNDSSSTYVTSKLVKQTQLPYNGSEDETSTNASLSDSSHTNDILSPMSPKDISTKPKSPGKATFSLSELIPIKEIAWTKKEEVVGKVVNEKEGYIHVLKLAEMIAESLRNDTTAF